MQVIGTVWGSRCCLRWKGQKYKKRKTLPGGVKD